MELMPEPDTENVAYIDEYPHLAEKVRLRRLMERRLGGKAVCDLLVLPTPINLSYE